MAKPPVRSDQRSVGVARERCYFFDANGCFKADSCKLAHLLADGTDARYLCPGFISAAFWDGEIEVQGGGLAPWLPEPETASTARQALETQLWACFKVGSDDRSFSYTSSADPQVSTGASAFI